jgi:hypothetical protein
MAIQDDLDALYACPLSEFLERRKALAAALRKAGQKDVAAAVASTAKPTPAAWAVNQLARRSPGEMAALMDAGAAVRAQLRASFAGRPDAGAKAAMAKAQADQQEAVTALVPLARALLEAGGASASAAVLDRVATTLTAISTTGTWGDGASLRLTKELDLPGIEALAALVADVVPAPAPAPATIASVRQAMPSEAREAPPSKGAQEKDDAARRAAAEAAERLAAAEAALQAAAAAEQQAGAALQNAQATVARFRERREERQAHARDATRLAAELEQAVEEARKKAQTAALAARKADAEVEDSVRAERVARVELSAAEQAVTRAATDRAAAEHAVLRAREASR